MKTQAIPLGLCMVVLIAALVGCSSTPREHRKPSVAILVRAEAGIRTSPADAAEIKKRIQVEVEKMGYRIAWSARTADSLVHVRYTVDPLAIGSITFERPAPGVPFLREHEEWSRDSQYRDYKRAIGDMVTDQSTRP